MNAFNDAVWSNYDDYKQTFGLKDPSTGETLRGFTVYLAGTNFRATSVQGNGVDTFSYYPFPTGGGSSEKAKRRLASKAISDNSPFSNYSIQGVPPGKYILRNEVFEYTRGEAIKKARMFGGKIEKIQY